MNANLNIEIYLFYFFVYAVSGWIYETTYKSISSKRFMNSGFLAGPYVPVYGFGAVVILSIEPYLAQYINEISRIALYIIVATVIYAASN